MPFSNNRPLSDNQRASKVIHFQEEESVLATPTKSIHLMRKTFSDGPHLDFSQVPYTPDRESASNILPSHLRSGPIKNKSLE